MVAIVWLWLHAAFRLGSDQIRLRRRCDPVQGKLLPKRYSALQGSTGLV
jgi:hypothetical protein